MNFFWTDTQAAAVIGCTTRHLSEMVEDTVEAQIEKPWAMVGSSRRWYPDGRSLFDWVKEVGEWRASAGSRTGGKSDGGGRGAGTAPSTPTPSAPTPKLVATSAAPTRPLKKAATTGPLESFRRGLSK